MVEAKRALRASVIPVAVILALVGAGLTLAALTRSHTPTPPDGGAVDKEAAVAAQPPPARPRTKQTYSERGNQTGVRDRIAGPVLPGSRPIAVSIPRLGVASDLVDLKVDRSGAMEVPTEAADAGWYSLGPSPGALGPSVIAGHVTWNQSPAVFFRLETLRLGDVVKVTREDGRTAIFSVTGVATYAKDRFPTEKVFGTIDHAGLRLITCGGTYDSAAHRYLDNVVVFASLVDVS